MQLFAGARDRVGRSSVEVELHAGATVADLRCSLAREYAELGDLLPRAMVAVDQEYAQDSHPLAASSEIAIIPPVSGG